MARRKGSKRETLARQAASLPGSWEKRISTGAEPGCLFCRIVRRELKSIIVLEDDDSLAFLDHRPLFPGHCLLVPKTHYPTLAELPDDLLGGFFKNARLLARAVEKAMNAEGSLVAINNRVSQSVPHVHVHIVPRRKGDGLKGFFWPRRPYTDEDEARRTGEAVAAAIASLRSADAQAKDFRNNPRPSEPAS